MSLFDHGDPEEFILFVQNFQITLAATGTPDTEEKFQYLRITVCGEALRQFDSLSSDVENTDTYLTVYYLIKGLAWYFFLCICFKKKQCAMRRCMKKPRILKVRCYAARLIDLNEYLDSFPGAPMEDKIDITELSTF